MDASAATSDSQIFSINPYEDHPSLTQIEASVLWEYAKLNQHTKDVRYTPTFERDRVSQIIERVRFVPPRFAVGHPDSHLEQNAGRSLVEAAQDFGEKDGPCFDIGA